MEAENPDDAEREVLRGLLIDTLALAERHDPMVAIYVETALAMLQKSQAPADRS